MRKVFLSFLGRGTYKPEKGIYEYDPAVYKLDGRKSRLTEFVQAAEIELLGREVFDCILIAATQASYDDKFEKLKRNLPLGEQDKMMHILVSEDMSPKGQWEWFERILTHIDRGDELTIDLTHGYRSVTIVFSAAINFLQKARDIRLKAVYYGAYEKEKELGYAPIVDMKDFYVINEWAEAVSRLVEDADARKMAQVSDRAATFQAGELNDQKLIQALEDLTDAIRNVDVNNVPYKAGKALGLIKEKILSASPTGKILLGLVIDKFASLTSGELWSGRYEEAYFALQLEVIRLLLEHKLFMQAYTAMREFIGSVAMINLEKEKLKPSDRRGKRRRFAEVFVNMVQFAETKWEFDGLAEKDKDTLMPFYDQLKQIGVEPILRGFSKELANYRNGFDHAWTMKNGAFTDIQTKGILFFNQLNEVVRILKDNRVFKLDAP